MIAKIAVTLYVVMVLVFNVFTAFETLTVILLFGIWLEVKHD